MKADLELDITRMEKLISLLFRCAVIISCVLSIPSTYSITPPHVKASPLENRRERERERAPDDVCTEVDRSLDRRDSGV